MYHLDDTICAIASAPGGAARGIVRLSGPGVLGVIQSCFRPDGALQLHEVTRPSILAGRLSSPEVPGRTGQDARESIPADLYFWPTDRSYTREPLAEIHLLGSPPLLAAVLSTLCAAGARPAEPGEFTLRAFLAGRLDLTQAEAVLGLIDAQGDRQFQTALAQMAGGLARPLSALRESLLDLLAELEAGLDFVDEDIEFISQAELHDRLGEACRTVAELAARMSSRTELADAVRAVLVGWPNVGKSSLFNALSAGSPQSSSGLDDRGSVQSAAPALVSDQPGTTRDYLVAWLDAPGPSASHPSATGRCQLIDTAGADPDEIGNGPGGLAQRSAGEQADRADVLLLCLDATRSLNAWERRQLAAPSPQPRFIVLTKCDARRGLSPADLEGAVCGSTVLETSAVTGAGLDALRQSLHAFVVDRSTGEDSVVAVTATRSRESLRLAGDVLARAAEANAGRLGDELIAAEVRIALAELGKVVGAVYTDDILDRIFSRFCIGK